MKTGLIWLVSLLTGFQVFGQEFQDSKSLFAEAQKLRKPVLLIFTGSDWCVPCIQLKKKVLQDSTFQKYAEKNLLVFIADFPQRKKPAPEQMVGNEELAAKFNPKGVFPYAVLVQPDQTPMKVLEVAHPSAISWVRLLDEILALH